MLTTRINRLKLSCAFLDVHVKITTILDSMIAWCYVHWLDVVLGLQSYKTLKEKLRNAPRTLNWANRPKQVGQVQKATLLAQLGRSPCWRISLLAYISLIAWFFGSVVQILLFLTQNSSYWFLQCTKTSSNIYIHSKTSFLAILTCTKQDQGKGIKFL